MIAPSIWPRRERRVTTEPVPSKSPGVAGNADTDEIRARVGVFRTGRVSVQTPMARQWVPILDGPPRADPGDALLALLDLTHQRMRDQQRAASLPSLSSVAPLPPTKAARAHAPSGLPTTPDVANDTPTGVGAATGSTTRSDTAPVSSAIAPVIAGAGGESSIS